MNIYIYIYLLSARLTFCLQDHFRNWVKFVFPNLHVHVSKDFFFFTSCPSNDSNDYPVKVESRFVEKGKLKVVDCSLLTDSYG